MTTSIAPKVRATLWCLLFLVHTPGCTHEQHRDLSQSELFYSFQLQRNGAYLNELEHYVVLLDRSDYQGLRAALQSNQDHELVVLCQELAGDRGHSVERDSIRGVVQRIADYRAQRQDPSVPHEPRVEECIRSLLASGGEEGQGPKARGPQRE